MSNLKELTWEHHKNAERQEFVREMFSGNLTKERYATFLFNQHPQYNLLEVFAMVHGLLDVRRAPAIHDDYQELWTDTNNQPPLLPVVKEYMAHLVKIQNDPAKLMAHIYVRHMGDLSGGQMLAKKVPGSGKMYKFDEPVDVLKEKIRARLDDSMAEEAKIAFDFATKLFQQMSEIKE